MLAAAHDHGRCSRRLLLQRWWASWLNLPLGPHVQRRRHAALHCRRSARRRGRTSDWLACNVGSGVDCGTHDRSRAIHAATRRSSLRTSFHETARPRHRRHREHPRSCSSARFDTVVGDEVEWPIEIEDPTTAELRAYLNATDEFSVTMQFSTTDLDQTGPVRLFTISDGTMSDQVNFHVGLERNHLSIRLRTSCELFNSVVVPNVVQANTVHRVAVTWGAGTLDVWVDTVKVSSTALPWGDLERWDPTYPIIVGDEAGGGRRFDGSVYSVVMWDRVIDETLITADSAP